MNQDDQATDQDGGTQPDQNADQPGAQTATKTEEPTVTQAQLAELESRKDREIAAVRKGLAQYKLDAEIRAARETENAAASADRAAIADGTLTETQATQRADRRQAQADQDRADAEAREIDIETYKQLVTEGGQLGRYVHALKVSKEHGLTPEDAEAIEKDMTLTSKPEMNLRAREIAQDRKEADAKGTETFDQGLTGNKGPSIADMSAAEKISYGLAHPAKTK
jgi:hypothetical protein|tara:strand:- start:269 stop:940 length:672 start_codon:yes stop_codon:yes gene_type:complete